MSVIYNIDIFAELPFCRPFIGPAQGSSEIKSMTHFSEYSQGSGWQRVVFMKQVYLPGPGAKSHNPPYSFCPTATNPKLDQSLYKGWVNPDQTRSRNPGKIIMLWICFGFVLDCFGFGSQGKPPPPPYPKVSKSPKVSTRVWMCDAPFFGRSKKILKNMVLCFA
jgi:hypothetical protein